MAKDRDLFPAGQDLFADRAVGACGQAGLCAGGILLGILNRLVAVGRYGLGLRVAGVMFTGEGFDAFLFAGRLSRDNAFVVVVAQGIQCLLISVAGVMFAGKGFDTCRLAGGGGCDNAFVPVVFQGRYCLRQRVAGVMFAGKGFNAVFLAGRLGRDNTFVVVVAQGRHCFRPEMGVVVLAVMCQNTRLLAGRGGRNLACFVVVVAQGRHCLRQRVAGVMFAGKGFNAVFLAGRLGRDNTFVVVVAQGCDLLLGSQDLSADGAFDACRQAVLRAGRLDLRNRLFDVVHRKISGRGEAGICLGGTDLCAAAHFGRDCAFADLRCRRV